MRQVQVYRLFDDYSWDLVSVFVPDEPWNQEIVESRACTAAWLQVEREGSRRPLRVGLFTIINEWVGVATQ